MKTIVELIGGTPGPWEINEVKGYRIDQIHAKGDWEKSICEMHDCGMPERFVIAAAPEMLEALEKIVSLIEECDNDPADMIYTIIDNLFVSKFGRTWEELKEMRDDR